MLVNLIDLPWQIVSNTDHDSTCVILTLTDGVEDGEATTTLRIKWDGCVLVDETPEHVCDWPSYLAHLHLAYAMAERYFDGFGVAPLPAALVAEHALAALALQASDLAPRAIDTRGDIHYTWDTTPKGVTAMIDDTDPRQHEEEIKIEMVRYGSRNERQVWIWFLLVGVGLVILFSLKG